MARAATAVKAVKGDRANARLEAILPEMHRLKQEMEALAEQHGKLRGEAFPLVEAVGDSYTTKDGVQGTIVRGSTWSVDPIRLLDRFGEKVKPLLEVSGKKFRDALDSGLLGPTKALSGIAKLEPITPQLRVTKK